MPRALVLRLALAWIDRNRSADFPVGDRGALLERNEDVGVARHHHFHAGLVVEQLAQPQRDVQHQLGLVDAVAVRARDRVRHGRRR